MKFMKFAAALCAALAILCCAAVPVQAAECTEHTYDAGTMVQAPTCETVGIIVYTCTVCGERLETKIGALGHHYVGGECSRCGAAEPAVPAGMEPAEAPDTVPSVSEAPAPADQTAVSTADVVMEHVTVTSGNNVTVTSGGTGSKTPSYVVLIGVLLLMAVVVTAGTDKPKKRVVKKKPVRRKPEEDELL